MNTEHDDGAVGDEGGAVRWELRDSVTAEVITVDDGRRWFIIRDAGLLKIKLSVENARLLYAALRMFDEDGFLK
jgi:hypothetical protein